jgi:hypothetical protein
MFEQIKHQGTTYDITDFGLATNLYREWKRGRGDSLDHLYPPHEGEVEICQDWLKQYARKRKTINERSSSYGLKHIVERAMGTYVSNGAFLLAAYRAGYTIVPDGPLNPNAHFNISFVQAERRWQPHERRCLRHNTPQPAPTQTRL